MRSITSNRRLILFIVTVLVGVMVAVSSVVAAARPTAVAANQAVRPAGTATCQLTGPRQGLEMNTVVAATLFKTVAMEKELFSCGQPAAGITQSRDLETFIELIEDASGRLVDGPNFSVSACISNPPVGTVRCGTYVPPTLPIDPLPLKGCQPQSFATPDDPVVMNTAVNGNIVKTIKVDKSWYTCDTPNGLVIQDIYVFTEILERPSKVPTTGALTLRPFARRFIGVECTKQPIQAIITGCRQFPVK